MSVKKRHRANRSYKNTPAKVINSLNLGNKTTTANLAIQHASIVIECGYVRINVPKNMKRRAIMRLFETAVAGAALVVLAGCAQPCPTARAGYTDQTSVFQARDQAIRSAQEAAQAADEAKAASERSNRAFRQSQMK
jgi:hypothetical protein